MVNRVFMNTSRWNANPNTQRWLLVKDNDEIVFTLNLLCWSVHCNGGQQYAFVKALQRVLVWGKMVTIKKYLEVRGGDT